MIESLHDARSHAAGAVKTAVAAPIGDPLRPRAIGPFAIVAHALPFETDPGALDPDFDVRPHPHIGLAAVTYMLQGHVTHRDSLGSRSEAGTGALHYMIAGRGVTHSERFDRLRTEGGGLELLQILMALPDGSEEMDPSFLHVAARNVPETVDNGARVRWLSTPVAFPAPMFLHDVELEPTGRYAVPDGYRERALYVLRGAVTVEGARVGAQQTALLGPGETLAASAEPTRMFAFGGEPVGPRYAWWNFIHSSLERLEAARTAWRAGRTPLPPGDTESFTPAPPDDGRPLQRFNALD